MNQISVVIICKDAAATIHQTLQSALLVSSDVVVIDSGSTDGTKDIVERTAARLTTIQWDGYGNAKNHGNAQAVNDWILSLDADEYLDSTLINSIKNASLLTENNVFTMLRLNYLGNTAIRFGEWKNDVVVRLFNKKNAVWDTTELHEELVVQQQENKIKLKGILHHYTASSIDAYRTKLKKYGDLMAAKYYEKGKKAHWYKILFAPVVNFVQGYILRVGFLDGRQGLDIALTHALYTYRKYKILRQKQRLSLAE